MSDNALSFIPPAVLDLIPDDVRQSIAAKLTPTTKPTTLDYPFPAPTEYNHTPLVQHAGHHYLCTGCGGDVPDGVRIQETIVEGMVIGMRMRAGTDPDGPIVHECGSNEVAAPKVVVR